MAKGKKSNGPKGGSNEPPSNESVFQGERELVVIARPEVSLRSTPTGVASAAGADITSLSDMLTQEGLTLRPLFGVGEERLQREATAAAERGVKLPDLSPYYRVDAPDDRLDELCKCFAENDAVEAAYVKPPAIPAMWQMDVPPVSDEAPPTTPNFRNRQGYLDAAPVGVDAKYAWTVPGGRGDGVRIIDIEGAWNFAHEDLLQNQGGVISGTPTSDLSWRNHGTAVIGEFGGDANGIGVTGICPRAVTSGVSIFGGQGSAAAIRHAADRLNPGDIILIELHRAGPRHNFQPRSDQRGYIAIEWWPDDYQAIRYAINKGVIVVEAAGNGAEDLADAIYDDAPSAPHGSFPSWWHNPFRRAPLDSGAIIVGAGAPPPGTHGRNHGPDRSRLGFSNYGPIVDTQGWGREVTTTGGRHTSAGDLQGGTNENEWYTDTFSGTSSASPIVVGTIVCLQGASKAASHSVLTHAQIRSLLRATGSPQTDAPGRPRTERIGNRPDLRQLLGRVVPRRRTVPLYRYWNARSGDHFYTTNWRELGRGRYGWRYEGIQCHVERRRRAGIVPLYRYWNRRISDHFYTTNWRELGRGRYGWRYEGIQCFVSRTRIGGTTALFRYWNRRIGDHFYTTNWRELGFGRYDYRLEGVAGYVYMRTTAPAPPEELIEMTAPEFEEPFAEPELGEELVTMTSRFETDVSVDEGELVTTGAMEYDSGPEFNVSGFVEGAEEFLEDSAMGMTEVKPTMFSTSEMGEMMLPDIESFLEERDQPLPTGDVDENGSFASEPTDNEATHGSNVAITINVEGEHQPHLVTTT